MKLYKLDKNFCSEVDDVSLLIERKYFSMLIGIFIMEGPHYFNELKKVSGLSAKTLSQRLNELLQLRIIDTKAVMDGKVKKQLYSPRKIAFDYYKVMQSMVKWGIKLKNSTK